MRKALLIVLCMIASAVSAEFDFNNLDWETIIDTASHAFIQFLKAFPTADDIHRAHDGPANFGLSPIENEMLFDQIQTRTMGMRRKLGLPLLGQGADGNVFASVQQESGFIAYGLGVVDCMMY